VNDPTTPSADFDLQTFLPYLLNQAAEATSQSFQQTYRTAYGMNRTEWRVVANLGKFGTLSASEICRIAHVEKTKVSRAVLALEQRGWLLREALENDRRRENLTLTTAGQAIFAEVGQQAIAFDRHLRARLGVVAAEEFTRALRLLAASDPEV
jgi:DNA-binding MarR family transcriptional regulator